MTTPAKPNTAVQTTKQDEKAVEYVPFGGSDKIRLTASMVRQFIAVPTRSGALPSERDSIRFIMLCRGKRADPFQGDCYMIGYDTQNGPSFSMVCGVELFLKRAEQSEHYDGVESGIVVVDANNVLTERPGALLLKGEKLVGGWAKVYRKDRSHPEYKTVSFETYNTGKSRWQADPAGMIEKVARSQGLRSAYPTALGGLYTQEEMQHVTEIGQGMFVADKDPISMPKAIDDAKGTDAAAESAAGLAPAPAQNAGTAKEKPPAQAEETVSQSTIRILTESGVSCDDCLDFLETNGLIKDRSSIGSYEEVPEEAWTKLRSNTKQTASLLKTFGKKK